MQRMSYAQVAQHHKDALKEKKEKHSENVSITPIAKTNTSTSNHNNINSNNGRSNMERESRGKDFFKNISKMMKKYSSNV